MTGRSKGSFLKGRHGTEASFRRGPRRRGKWSLSKSNTCAGLFFVSPFIVGTAVFFLYPLLNSIFLSFGEMDTQKVGYHIKLIGFGNYIKAFQEDVNFLPYFLETIESTVLMIPLIVIFSLLLAVLLNKMSVGKGFFRVAMFLPFLLGTGEVIRQLQEQGVDKTLVSITNSEVLPRELLTYLGDNVVEVLDFLFGHIVRILWSCGVQSLLFLSAIQGVSPSLYESAKIDGANEYEMFWKITLPMVSPIALLVMIYTVISTFSSSDNQVLAYMQLQISRYAAHGYASAIGWIYFVFVFLLLGIVYLLIGRYVRKNISAGYEKKGRSRRERRRAHGSHVAA